MQFFNSQGDYFIAAGATMPDTHTGDLDSLLQKESNSIMQL